MIFTEHSLNVLLHSLYQLSTNYSMLLHLHHAFVLPHFFSNCNFQGFLNRQNMLIEIISLVLMDPLLNGSIELSLIT